MKQILQFTLTALLLTSSSVIFSQSPQSQAEYAAQRAKSGAKAATSDKDVTYGRIKELTAGQKVVINVDNAPDKSFDLKDDDVALKMAGNLKVGDPVKVQEHDALGKKKSVMITKHTGKGVTHGDPNPVTK